MYAYLLDSNSMLVPDGNHAIEVFLHVHNIFIRMLSELNETGHVPHSSMMKAYYKFRHNIFACLCRLSLGAEPAPLETDVPLSTWLPDSKKTPDFIVSKDDSLMLYEFTVGNTYERVDYLKGGGNRDIKYASECREIQSTGKRCSVVIVAAVLDSYNMEEVMLQLDSRSEEEALRMYFEIANTNKDVVSSNMVKSDNFSSMPPPESPGLELYPRPPQQDIVLVPNDVLSAVATDFSELMGMLETRNDYFNVSIVFDTDKMRYKVDRAKRGKRPSEWIQTLNPSPSKLIPNIRFRRDGKPVSFRKLGGTVPVTVFAPRRESRFEPWYETASFDALYLNTVPVYKPGYGEPEYFTEANVHHITDSQPVCFPPDYFDLLCTMKVEPLLACKSRKMLYNCKMDMQEIDNSMVLFEDSMAVNNVIDVYRPKPTFLLAFPSETLTASEVQVPEELARAYLRFGKGLYTKEVLRRAVEGRFATTRKTQFNAELRELYESYHSANSSYYKKMMSLCHGMKKFRDLDDAKKQELKPLRDTVKAESKAYRSFLGRGKAVLSDRLVKLHVGSQMQTSWDSEMQHYNRNEGRAAVGFYSNHSGLHDYFTKLLRRMVDTNFCSTRYRDLFTRSTSKGSPFLDSQKQDFQTRYRHFYDSKLHGTLLMQLCHFVERVSKFLFNESLKTYNNDYVKIDNLGYNNILIMVRGGAKLYKHQRSRLYRIFFPIAPEDLKYSGYGENDSYEVFDHDSRKYVATPWSQVHQDVLFDYMFAPERVFNQLFSVCSRLDNSLERDIEPLSVFPSLLLFHNRRKTETLLHNSRYLIVNPLGFSANLCGIMPSLQELTTLIWTLGSDTESPTTTETLLATTRKTQFNAELRGLYESYHSANSSYYKRMMSLCHGMKKFRDLNAAEKQELKPLRDTVKAESKAYRSFLGKGKAVLSDRLVKLHVGSQMQTSWDSEMQHYNRSEGRAAVGFYSNHSGLHDYFTKLLRRMVDTNFCSTRYRDLFTGSTSKGSPFLDSQKQDFQKRYRNFYDSKLHGTLLMQLCHFVERVSKFLFNESLKTYNNDYVKIDNLGYSNILIMVRGGAKLYKHQRSRLYRIFFPIAPEDLKYSGYGENDSYEIFDHDSRKYVATPWSQVHQDVLFDYMFAPERVFNQLFSVCSRLDNSLERDIEPLSVFPSLLLFHNRRKTETLLHNSRYLIVNPLGFSANLCGIMPSFAGTNYTYLDTWLRHRISDHYRDFAASMMQIRDSGSRRLEETLDKCGLVDLWVGEPLVKPDLLTLFIYSTYMMTKAPVNSSLEQAANLWEILSDVKEFSENHADVHEMDDKSLRFDVTNFDESVYHDDFKYDPVFSEYLGFYMANYLAPKLSIGELSNKWDSIVSRDIDTCATSKGLRGYNASNFFNRKGYDIMYSKVNELLSDDEIQTRIEGYLQADHATAAQAIQADKMSFGGYDKDYESLVFHIVHKIQRGGSREIFCMDLNTKVIQSPVETFFTHLCKKVPNEFISVPSGKRHGRIHSDFYEKKVGRWVKNVVRWVLDCRRWAPHSVFQKYIHFINGMSHILPSAFLEHFYSMSKGMMGKKFITREHVMSKIRNNKRFEPYKNLIKPLDGIANAVYMSVKFSFVMGIFNYLSTLMHASNQLVAAEVVRNQCLNRGMGLVILDAKCHSDDSVVSSYHEDRKSVELSAKLYDWLLKGANHMLSVKKSQLNDDVYLEFLSTLYVMDRFLPVFPKFVSTLPFKPSDRGLMSDVSFSVSQAIELMTIGGSFEEAYLLMKTTDNAVRRIYNIPAIEGLPPQLFGDVDAHPVELLVSGSNADLYNFYRYNTEKFWNVYNTLAAQGLVDLEDISFSFSWDMGAMLDNNITKRIRDMSPIMEKLHDAQWTIRNCKLGNSSINLLWYYLKMQDRKFRSALVDEPVARRMSRIFGSAGYRRLQKSDGSLVEVSKVHAVLQYGDLLETNSYPTFTDEYLQFMSKELADLHSSLSDTSVTSQQPMGVKEKPITLVLNSPSLGSGNLSASEFVSYVKEPVGYKLLGRFRNPAREVERLRQELSIYNIKVDDCSPEMLYSVSRKLMGKEQHIYHMVAAVPSGLRYLNSYTHILQLLSTGTYAHRKLVLKNSTAAGIDWEKKLVAGRMPDSAREYIKSFWLCQTLDKAKLLDKDIYTANPRDTEHESAQRLPDEWKVILLTSVMQRHLPLSQINHWIYWEKEQIRLGHSWVGTGICVVKLPEATIRVTMASGSCRKVEVCTSHGGLISQSSSWFLHNVLQHGAVSAQFYDKSLALPNQHYLGVVSNSCIYGFGGASQFDMIYDVEWTEADPIPSEFYTELKCERVRNHYVYRGPDKDYYIDFFVPVSDPVSISFKGVFDPVKLKEYSDDEAVSDFIKKLSVDLGGLMEIDFTHMLDNLGSSTIYHIMYEGPARQAVLEGQPAEDAMVSAFAGWKKTHPDFGYPDEDQVERLYKDPESPPFPKLVMDHLLRIGKTNMNDSEFQAILIHLTGLSKEDREVYLASNFGFLDKRMRTEAMVMVSRSKLVFKTCALIGGDALKLLVPFVCAVRNSMASNSIISSTLESMRKTLYFSRKIKMSSKNLFFLIACKCIYDGLAGRSNQQLSLSYSRLQTVLCELWENGLGFYLNTTPYDDPRMRTIDFSIGTEEMKAWLDDLVSAHYNYNYRLKLSTTTQRMLRGKEDVESLLGPCRSQILRFNSLNTPPSITVVTKKKTEILKYQEPNPRAYHERFRTAHRG
uniref:RNA-directed RNA polymerase L n=1 Tax=Halophytophthora RNA virus 1 TaxID=2717543 RepID=A0A7D5KJ30_9VIRU|nr:RNA-dependent RNA polymerase [Halophytophthora RNA virus 1]